jgi:hypothetical protein
MVAWCCANIPATAPIQVFAWIKGASHFSHSAGLRQSVASLLAGQPRDTAPRVAAAESKPDRQSPPPALPTEAGLKKVVFDPSTESFRLIAALPAGARTVLEIHAPAEPVVDVPYPPPRLRALA